jgi:hypothetical protein
VTIVIAKSLRCLAREDDVLELANRFVMRIAQVTQCHPVFVSLAAKLLGSLHKSGFPVDLRILPWLLGLVPHAVTPDLFKIIVRLCDTLPEVYMGMARLIPELVWKLGEEIGDGICGNDGESDIIIIMCDPLFRLLKRIIRACGEDEYGELLFSFVKSHFLVCECTLDGHVMTICRDIVDRGSDFIGQYIEFFASMMEEEGSSLGEVLRLFAHCLVKCPERCSVDLFDRVCEKANHTIQSRKIGSAEDLFWAATFFAQMTRVLPNSIDLPMALASAEVILSSIDHTDQPMRFSAWLQHVAGYMILAAVFSIAPSDIGPEALLEWARFIETEGLPSPQYVSMHAAGIAAEIAAFPNYSQELEPFIERLYATPDQFVAQQFNHDTGRTPPALRRILRDRNGKNSLPLP